ncbi:MAG: (2Fe-2S)-binding protein [Opitutae bacterium]|nr:(2Fe-2S)-binding protein [Opitutae bacterium]|tara:strand:+ start:179 stop:733 length:555 start_codon:yes stop_codon:yes gene_type:complete
MTEKDEQTDDNKNRRKFIVTSTIGASAACALFPFASGLPSVLDPVTKKSDGASTPWTKVTALASLPEDGTPTKFEVVLEKVKDAWTTYTNIPVGAVYLARSGDKVTAYNLKCPHLGCAIDYRSKSNDYFCPCHNSTFALDGSVTTENSPSPRGMDTMDTKIEDGSVWIRFQQFRPNIAEKIPLS